MRRLVAFRSVLLPLLISGNLAASAEPLSASQLPAELAFNVWLDDRPMGEHRYSFATKASEQPEQGDLLIVTSEADFEVKVLFVSVFSYNHTATEHWLGNCLRAVSSTTTTNGEDEALQRSIPATDCAGTYVYWDKSRLRRAELTNAQTGEVESAEWQDRGMLELPRIGKRKRVRPDPGEVSAVQLRTPSAVFDLYYDAKDRLLMMQTDNDGRTITYLHESLVAK